jgi:polysaccharide export outer membrane protein
LQVDEEQSHLVLLSMWHPACTGYACGSRAKASFFHPGSRRAGVPEPQKAGTMHAPDRIRRLAVMLASSCALAISLGACGVFAVPPEGTPPPATTGPIVMPDDGVPPEVTEALLNQGPDPLRLGDIVRLRIWREAEMSGDYTVNEDGDVVLPRVGAIRVAGEQPAEVKTRITQAFARFLQNPSIEVTLLRRVQVLGAVRNPGLYPVDPTMTVSDALALAGGTTTDGSPNRVVLIREGVRLPVKLEANTPIASASIRSGDQIYVDQRSWISRNTGVVTAAITGVVSLIIAFGTR